MSATSRPKHAVRSRIAPSVIVRETDRISVLIVDANRMDAERSRMELQGAGVAMDFRVVATLDELRSTLTSFTRMS